MIPHRRRLRLGLLVVGLSWVAAGTTFAAGVPAPTRFPVFSPGPIRAAQPLAAASVPPSSWLRVDATAVRALREAGQGNVLLPLGDGRTLDLSLERVDVLAPGATVTQTDERGVHALVPDVTLFRGTVNGEPGSWVSLACSPGEVLGVVSTAGDRWDVGPVREGGPAADGAPHVVVNERDLAREPGPFECGADELAEALGVSDRSALAPDQTGATRSRLLCQVAIDCDYEFYSGKFGSNLISATDYVLTLMAVVSTIYERDLNVTLQISYLNVWTTASDPYTAASTTTELPEFKNYWNANRSGVARRVAHLMSGRALGGGIAYVGTLCSLSSSYSVSSLDANYAYPTNTVTWDAEVVAHEIGHNFNSQHTHSCWWQANGLVPAGTLIDSCYTAEGTCYGGPTGILPPDKGTIMSYCHLVAGVANGIRLDFHPVCIQVMRAHAENCLPAMSFQPPIPLVATAGVSAAALHWTPSAYPGILRYDVHRSVTMLDPAPAWLGSTADTTMTDDNLLGTYYYKVRAVTATDTSDFSNEAQVAVCTPDGPAYYAAGGSAVSPVIADFNGDGIPDLAIANDSGAGTVSILLGQGSGGVGDGTFAAAVAYPCGANPISIAAGDFNGDGITDLAVANNATIGTWSLLAGQGSGGIGDGTFAAPVAFTAASKPAAIVAGDFDDDGILDVAVASNAASLVSIYRGLGAAGVGTGGFADSVNYRVDSHPVAMVAGDWNADGITDLALVCGGTGSVCVLMGQGSFGAGLGTFAPAVSYGAGTGAVALASGDLNGDGIADLVVVRNGSQGLVSVLFGNGMSGVGDGTFAPALVYAAGPSSNAVVAADLNGNGATDLAVSNGNNTISILLGQTADGVPTGALGPPQTFALGSTPQAITAGDFDEDGIPDLLVTSLALMQSAGLRRGTCPASAATTIDLIAPNGGEEWPTGSERWIEWTKGPAVPTVKVEVSRDGGAHWRTLANNVTGTRWPWSVTPPECESGQALVRVSDAVVAGRADVSDAGFRIVPPTLDAPASGPRRLAIQGVYPNPSSGAMNVSFALPSAEPARLELLDVAGRRVAASPVGALGPGPHSIRLAGARVLPTGVYLLRLDQGGRVVTAKAVVTR